MVMPDSHSSHAGDDVSTTTHGVRPPRERRKSLSLARSLSSMSAIQVTPAVLPTSHTTYRDQDGPDTLLHQTKSNPLRSHDPLLDDVKETSFDEPSPLHIAAAASRRSSALNLDNEQQHHHHHHSLTDHDREDVETALLREELEGDNSWQEGFEKPDRGEMMAMMVSGGLVALLAVAAGLATVYDWVL
jgi:hypothetical protein